MKKKVLFLWNKLEPIRSVLIFLAVLFSANLVWKLSVYGDDSDTQVLLFNAIDISGLFNFFVINTTNVVRDVVEFFGYNIHYRSFNDVRFYNDNYVSIVWGCTAIKQSFIFLCIMLFTPGPPKAKLWYIPLGLLLIYLFNIFRISFIAISVEQYPQYFKLLHEGLFKYLFYAFIFFIWVYWEEKFNKKNSLRRKQLADKKLDSESI